MNHFNILKKIKAVKDAQVRIENYKELIKCTFCHIYKLKIEDELVKDIEIILDLIEEINSDMETYYMKNINRQTKEFTLSELADYDGHK